jgi:hypothetical protein
VLPTHGDVIAPPRPDRAEPPVSVLASLITLTAVGCERPLLAVRPVLPAAPVRAALPSAPPSLLPGRTARTVAPGCPVRPGVPGARTAPALPGTPGVRDDPAATLVPALPGAPGPSARPQTAPAGRAARREARRRGEFIEPKGCLYALSQPPLMLFLCVIGGLLGAGAGWDLLFL